MGESTDLIRRLDSAISTKSLHPEYARGLLREAKEALEDDSVRVYPEPVRPVSFFPLNSHGKKMNVNLPEWATHVAVDFNVVICAFEGKPVWSDDTAYGGGGVWIASPGKRFYTFDRGEEITLPLARLLCVEVPRAPVEESEE